MLSGMKGVWWGAVLLLGCGGADGSCADLAALCETCPDTPAGNQARSSCRTAVESQDELACEDRLDRDVYASAGCTEP